VGRVKKEAGFPPPSLLGIALVSYIRNLARNAEDVLPQRHKDTKNIGKTGRINSGLIRVNLPESASLQMMKQWMHMSLLCVLVSLWFNLFLFDSGSYGLGGDQ
jgi:hypothetical protein